MKTPTVVVFDLGKVLLDFDYSIAARKLAARCAMDMADIRKLVEQSSLLVRYETGHLTTAEFFEEARATINFPGDRKEFGELFGDIFTPMDEMIALHGQMVAAGIPTFIFSNTNELAVQHIREHFPFFSRFDGYVLSYEEGAMKPQQEIYEVVEARTNRAGLEILYIDDRPENVQAGAERGWHVILQETPEKTRSAIQQLGLLLVAAAT